jgi:iron complex outermembrane recepter protein
MQRGLVARFQAAAAGSLKRLLLAGALWACVWGVSPVSAAQEAIASDYDIASESADQALIEFARQTKEMKLSVLVPSGDFARTSTNAVHGRYPPDEALTILLRDTGLAGSIGPTGIVAITRLGEEDMRGNKSHRKWVAGLLGYVAAHLFGPIAVAQEAPASTADATVAPTEELEQVTVTGSRVITNGNQSPTPLTVVSIDQLQTLSPGPVSSALAMLPELEIGTTNNDIQPQAVFDLRGLGGTRNLVLFDGLRLAPTTNGTSEAVDTNLIPQMLLKRVDVVTGGASAVYGSDAVSGVINYVVDNNFNGVKVTGQAGTTSSNLDHTNNIGIAAGTPLFDGRGHIEASFQSFNDPGISNRFDTPWGRELESEQGVVPGSTSAPGTPQNPFALYTNTRLSNTSFGGLIMSGPLSGYNFTQNGALSPFVHGTATGTPTAEIGGGGGYFTAWAYPKTNLDQAFVRLDYDLTDSTKIYFELPFATALYVANDHSPNMQLSGAAIGYNNAFLSGVQPAYQAIIANQIATNPLSSFKYSRIFTSQQMPSPIDYNREVQWLPIIGIEGSLSKYKWKLTYEHQDTVTDTSDPNNVSNARLDAALNSVVNPANNQVVCHAALVNAAYANCVPLNAFGPGSTSAQAFNYIQQDSFYSTTYTMDDVTASLTGAPVNDWAGPINMALSGEWRRLTYRVDSNAAPNTPLDCTGIQFNCTAGGSPYFATTSASFPGVSEVVTEFAYEAEVPLLKDLPLAKSLALNGAARWTNYQTSGGVWTWKVGGTWAVNDSLNLRGTRSRDIRAPGLVDLYQPATVSVTVIDDLHTGVSGNVNQLAVGNPNLTPETADTWTGGFVWTPQFLQGASLSLDYYHINVTNALNALSAKQPATILACDNSNGTSPVCGLYVRPYPFSDSSADNFPSEIINQELNTAGLLTYGADGELDYAHPIAGHHFLARLLVNYQPHLIYNLGSAGILDVGGAADGVGGLPPVPNVKGVLDLNYELVQDVAVTVQERYRNALKQNGSPLIYFDVGKIPPVCYTDLTLNYRLRPNGSDLNVFLNIRNLFNKEPDPWASSGGNAQIGSFGGFAPGDDVLGRYFTVGFSYKL